MKYLKNYNTFILESLIISGKELTTLVYENIPEIIDGDFSCSNNKLLSLEGSPKIVRGQFTCSHNKLTSLVGAPIKVVDMFYCYDNELTSLDGAPKEVGGHFDCSDNRLISLIGAPKEVGGFFKCNVNNLKSLEGAPKKVGSYFYCSENNLTSLDYLPEYIGGELYCYDNNWHKPIPYNIMIKYDLHILKIHESDYKWVYSKEQFYKFSFFYFQKDFLEREPENYLDLKLFGYAEGIEELFPHLFDMYELGLID